MTSILSLDGGILADPLGNGIILAEDGDYSCCCEPLCCCELINSVHLSVSGYGNGVCTSPDENACDSLNGVYNFGGLDTVGYPEGTCGGVFLFAVVDCNSGGGLVRRGYSLIIEYDCTAQEWNITIQEIPNYALPGEGTPYTTWSYTGASDSCFGPICLNYIGDAQEICDGSSATVCVTFS